MSRHKKDKGGQAARSEDVNPVYGFYYFSDGQKIDDNKAEATDKNLYYESWIPFINAGYSVVVTCWNTYKYKAEAYYNNNNKFGQKVKIWDI